MLPGAEMAGVGGAELDDDLRDEVDGVGAWITDGAG